jgi:hypothetical protein
MTTGLVRSFGFAALVALGALGAPVVASASPISLFATTGTFLFTFNGGGLVSVSTNGSSISGMASFEGDSGAYTLNSPSSGFIVGPQSGNSFPAAPNSTQGFSYTSLSDSDKLSGTITWSSIHDGTTTPEFFGTLLVTSATGDLAFTSSFPNNAKVAIDLITQALASNTTCPAPCSLESLVTNGGRTTALVGTGTVSAVPLPAALPLFATGIGGLGLLGWRRKRKAQAVA